MSEPPAELLARIADGIEAIERTVGELRSLQDVSRERIDQYLADSA